MRRKQTGPELKLFELDTLKYITPDNLKDSIELMERHLEDLEKELEEYLRK